MDGLFWEFNRCLIVFFVWVSWSFHCEFGIYVHLYSWPNGGLLDDPNAEVGPPQGTLADTVPAGLIMQEVIEFDNTRSSQDMSDFEKVMAGSKLAVYSKGWCVTRCISSLAHASLAGKPAYYDANGYFTTVSGSPCVGTFQSERDADGFARVYVDVPAFGRKAGL